MSDGDYMVFPASAVADGSVFGYHTAGDYVMYSPPAWMGIEKEGMIIVPTDSVPTLLVCINGSADVEIPLLLDRLCNGRPVFHAPQTGSCCYYDSTGAWVLILHGDSERLGLVPMAYLDIDGKTWVGDGWYTLANAPTLSDEDHTWCKYEAHGTLLNTTDDSEQSAESGTDDSEQSAEPGTDDSEGSEGSEESTEVRMTFPRYVRKPNTGLSPICGEYEPVDGAGDAVLIVGYETYKEENSATTWRKLSDGECWKSSAGEILQKNDDGHFIVGIEGTGRWWRASGKPSRVAECILRLYEASEDGKPESLDEIRTLSFAGFDGGETMKAYVSEVAVWH